jgi:hypothetical protein
MMKNAAYARCYRHDRNGSLCYIHAEPLLRPQLSGLIIVKQSDQRSGSDGLVFRHLH